MNPKSYPNTTLPTPNSEEPKILGEFFGRGLVLVVLATFFMAGADPVIGKEPFAEASWGLIEGSFSRSGEAPGKTSFREEKKIPFTKYFGRVNEFPAMEISCIVEGAEGDVYVGTYDRGIIQFREGKSEWTLLPPPE